MVDGLGGLELTVFSIGVDLNGRTDGFPASEKGRRPRGIWRLVGVTLASSFGSLVYQGNIHFGRRH